MHKLFKFLLTGLSAMSLITLTGCQAAPKAPEIPVYKASTLPEGIFIKKAKTDNTFHGIYIPSQATNADFQWEATEDHLIPHIEPGDELVLHTVKEIPDVLTLYSMKDFGYTAGMRVTNDKNGYFTIDEAGEMWCPDSILLSFWQQQLGDFDGIRLVDIEGNEFSSKTVSSLGFLKGLEKDATYNINLYKGTEFKTIKTKADSHAFIRDREYSLKNYVEMQDMYFVITLPKNMTSGYWIIDGYGMFFLEDDVELTGTPLEEITEEIDTQADPSLSEALLDDAINPEDVIEEPEDAPMLEPTTETPAEPEVNNTTEAPAEPVAETPQG